MLTRFFTWWRRLFGTAPPPAPSPALPSAADAAPLLRVPTAPQGAGREATALALPAIAGLRRPLIGSRGEVAGFEIRHPDSVAQRLRGTADPTIQAAHAAALLSSIRSTLQAGRMALIALPPAVLVRPTFIEQVTSGACIALDVQPGLPLPAKHDLEATVHALRGRGVRVGEFQHLQSTPLVLAAPDFLVFSAHGHEPSLLLTAIQRWRVDRPAAAMMVLDLASIDDIEQVLRAGVSLAAGKLEGRAAHVSRSPLQASVARICQLLNDLVLDRPAADVAADIRADVALSYRLLRHVSSAAFGLQRQIESVDQAVLVLGRKGLYRWLSVLLLAQAHARPASRALQEVALTRGRLFELLAEERGVDPPDALFTVGLLSLLDAMLQMPMQNALELLRLGETARAALLEHAGPWRPYLDIVAALEMQNYAAVEALAAPYGGVRRVLECAESAWTWAQAAGADSAA